MNGNFTFTITDVARFLDKSPVTLRSWEQKGEARYPRDQRGDRKFTAAQVRDAAWGAYEKRRIPKRRVRLVDAIMTLLELVEQENTRENRSHRSTQVRKD